MIPAALKKLIGIDEAKLAAEVEALKLEQREFQRSLGPHVEDGHRLVDALVESARESFVSTFRDPRGIPGEYRHPFTPALVDAFVVSSPAFAEAAHNAVDEAAAGSAYDTTPREQINDRLSRFRVDIQSRELALERIDAKRRADAEKQALDDVDRRAQEVLGDK